MVTRAIGGQRPQLVIRVRRQGGLSGPAVLGNTWTTPDFDCIARESFICRLAAPHVGITPTERGEFRGRQVLESGVGLLDMLKPARRVELMENYLARQLNQRGGNRRRVLGGYQDTGPLMAHLPDHLDKTRDLAP